MSETQFGRAARLSVQREGEPVGGDGIQFESRFSGLRIQFKVEKSPAMAPNTADISIYNLAESSRRQLKSVGALVTLEAAYSDNSKGTLSQTTALGVVFKGNARTIDHVRKGSEWITHIQCGDGEIGYRYSQANQSFKGGTALKDAAKYLAQQLQGIDVSGFLQQLASGKITGAVTQFVNGVSFFGNAGEELERLMAAAGYQLSIQDHELTALKLTQTSSVVVVLTPTSGLVGSPEHGTPDKSGLPAVLKAKCLLQPRIRPGDRVRFQNLKNERVNGDYRAVKVTHTGDTHGLDWYTDSELRPVASVS
jgi:hypothetical protein